MRAAHSSAAEPLTATAMAEGSASGVAVGLRVELTDAVAVCVPVAVPVCVAAMVLVADAVEDTAADADAVADAEAVEGAVGAAPPLPPVASETVGPPEGLSTLPEGAASPERLRRLARLPASADIKMTDATAPSVSKTFRFQQLELREADREPAVRLCRLPPLPNTGFTVFAQDLRVSAKSTMGTAAIFFVDMTISFQLTTVAILCRNNSFAVVEYLFLRRAINIDRKLSFRR